MYCEAGCFYVNMFVCYRQMLLRYGLPPHMIHILNRHDPGSPFNSMFDQGSAIGITDP